MPGGRSGARFLLRAAVSNTSLARVSPKLLDDDGSFSSDLFSAFDHILNAVRKKVKFFGTMKEKGEIEIAMCRASINADVHGYPQEALRLAGMFPSEEALLNAVARIIANSLDIEDAAGIYKRPYQQ